MRNLIIDGDVKTRGKCIIPYKTNFAFPTKDLRSADLQCRSSTMDLSDVESCPVKAGSTITMQWRQGEENEGTVIQRQHVGPCIVYMARINPGISSYSWFKIFEDGYNQKWCVEKLISNGGKLQVKIPENIKPGEYLLRGEVIGLSEASRPYGKDMTSGAQFYANCARVQVSGTGTGVPDNSQIAFFPGYYGTEQPGILFDINKSPINYTIPGPKIFS
ncbi:hypothetical protein LPJ66_001714 [Kickxella alabastrina]|uniref:Uncharacterized protein n=1 Tax=Kickxella alabastrina TaxID=61397 RepID=A0ACC1ISF6_9FUNG|nr:hypothetical protein LPJ66_001714 [Kickxella alabastrina]